MEHPRLYRSRKDSVIGGVCGGLGEYLNTDPILFRVLFAVVFFVGGTGLLAYIILWIVIPLEEIPETGSADLTNKGEEIDNNKTDSENMEEQNKQQKNDGNLWGGLILITLGAIFLIDRFVPRIDFGDLWPLILIVVGAILISKSYQQPKK